MQVVNRIIAPLKLEALDKWPALAIIQEKTKVKPSILLLIIFAILLLFSPILKTHAILTAIVCYLVPAYLSFLALESKQKQDDIRYLTYWIVFSLGQVITPLTRLFFNKFTYTTFRIILTLALLHPESPLANIIYTKGVQPFLHQNQQTIDQKLDELAKQGKQKLIQGVQQGLQHI